MKNEVAKKMKNRSLVFFQKRRKNRAITNEVTAIAPINIRFILLPHSASQINP